MFWVTALCNSPQDFLNELAHWSAHSRIPNLLAGDKATIDGLPERLADEVPFDRTHFACRADPRQLYRSKPHFRQSYAFINAHNTSGHGRNRGFPHRGTASLCFRNSKIIIHGTWRRCRGYGTRQIQRR
jgi:hypothetical protein